MKLLSVLGTRPQFIKACMVDKEISKQKVARHIIVHTGQHFDDNMSKVFFDEMGIPKPSHNLGINTLGHGAMTGRMLEAIEDVLKVEKPDLVLVYGDTNSTLAGALAARKLGIKIGHVEAGLRSLNMEMPEEINRILTDRISDLLFCPTDAAIQNLKREGFGSFPCQIVYTGDIMYDSVLYFTTISDRKSTILQDLNLEGESFILCTVHRQENTDNRSSLESIVKALNDVHRETRVIVPMHPRTRKEVTRHGIRIHFDMVDSVSYLDMLSLLKNCRLVITDSGGLQKEAFFFKKHCVTIRAETEWVELVEHGFNLLAGASYEKILEAYNFMLGKTSEFNRDLYGNGKAREVIVKTLITYEP